MRGARLVTIALVLASASGCLVASPVMTFGGKSSAEAEHTTFDKLLPAQLTARTAWSGPVRTAKLRVWADDEYRAQNVHWQRSFGEQLEYVNQVLNPMLGIQLVADYREWDHHVPSASLSDHMAALAASDPGDDVVWVVGLTSSLSLVSATFEQLGVAQLGGRHLMIRGYTDIEERKAFERAFPEIGGEERQQAIEARRRHKTATVLLHEMAHSLGALHETEADVVMHATYSHHAAWISDRNRELMLITLAQRLKPAADRDPQAAAQATLAQLSDGWPGWVAAERAELVEQLGHESSGSEAQAALAAAQPVVASSHPGPPRLPMREEQIAKLPPDEATPAWLSLADHYRDQGAITQAELAVARSAAEPGADLGIAAWAAMTRVRYGVPRDGARWQLTVSDEPAALDAVHRVLDLAGQGQFADADEAAAIAERRWPNLPGIVAARCDLAYRRHAFDEARAQCDRAIAQGGSSWALYLSGILYLQGGTPAAARAGVANLRAAIELDPELRQAWQALHRQFKRVNATSDLAKLRHAYAARFGEPL